MIKNFLFEIKTFVTGVSSLKTIQPGLILCSVIMAITDSILPFINIYFSSQLINEILGYHRIITILEYIVIVLFSNFIFQILSQGLNRLRETKNSCFYFKYCLLLSYKNHEIDFSHLESVHARNDFQKTYDNFIYGGLSTIPKLVYDLINNFFSCVIALTLSYELFFTYTNIKFEGLYSIVNSHISTFLIVVLIVLSAIITSKICLTYNKKSLNINTYQATENKQWMFYEREYIENFKAGKDIRLFNQKELILSKIKNSFDKIINLENKRNAQGIKSNVYISVISDVLITVIYILVALKCLVGVCAAGNIIQFTNSIKKFITSTSNIVITLVQIFSNNKYLLDYNKYMSIPNEIRTNTTQPSEQVINDIDLNISFDNVCFCYPNTTKYALENFSLKIGNNEHIAIVGMNGSGKTTLVKLLCRLYKPQKGTIMINNKDIYEYPVEEYLKLLAVIFQDFKFLGFPIINNISANITPNEELALRCLEQSGFIKFDMKDNIYSPINRDFFQDGVELSTGELQRVAIARSLYKNAPILIMDEPTASLDPITEANIYENINKFMNNKTIVYISHRLASCKFCDKIVVLENGKIVQYGNHNTLVNIKGKYKELWDAQSQYYKYYEKQKDE